MPAARQLQIAITLLVANILIATFFYMHLGGVSFIDAIYMVIVTIFTVGYDEHIPIDTAQMKIFNAIFIVVGCTSLIYCTGALVQFLTASQIRRALGARHMNREIDKLKNHVIVCGSGRIGRMIGFELDRMGRKFVIIDSNEAHTAKVAENGWLVYTGDATSEHTLESVGIHRAQRLATVLPDDAMNVFITLTAKDLNPDIDVIARGEEPSTEKKLLQAGARRVVLPAHIGAERIAHLIIHPTAAELLDDEKHSDEFAGEIASLGMRLREFPVERDSPLVGKATGEAEVRGHSAFLIIAIRKADGQNIGNPPADTILAEGDNLIVLGHKDDKPAG